MTILFPYIDGYVYTEVYVNSTFVSVRSAITLVFLVVIVVRAICIICAETV